MGTWPKTNSIARLVPSQRWRPAAILSIKGTPARPTALDNDDAIIESFSNPQRMLNAEQRALLDKEDVPESDLPLCLHNPQEVAESPYHMCRPCSLWAQAKLPNVHPLPDGSRQAQTLKSWGFVPAKSVQYDVQRQRPQIDAVASRPPN